MTALLASPNINPASKNDDWETGNCLRILVHPRNLQATMSVLSQRPANSARTAYQNEKNTSHIVRRNSQENISSKMQHHCQCENRTTTWGEIQ